MNEKITDEEVLYLMEHIVDKYAQRIVEVFKIKVDEYINAIGKTEDRYLTVKEVASYLKCSRQSVYDNMNREENPLPYYDIPLNKETKRVILLSNLKEWCKAYKRPKED